MLRTCFTRSLLYSVFWCCAGSFATVTIDEVRTRFSDLKGIAESSDPSVVNRFELLLSIFNDQTITDAIQSYNLKSILTHLGIEHCDKDDSCLTELLSRIDELGNPAVPTGYQGSPVGFATVHSILNRITKFVIDGVIQNGIGAPSDTSLIDGNTLWSRLNWVLDQVQNLEGTAEQESLKKILGFHGDDFSTEPYTVSSLWRLIQRCLDGTLCLVNVDLIATKEDENLIAGVLNLNQILNSLCNSIYINADAATILISASSLLTTSRYIYNLLVDYVNDVQIASPNLDINTLDSALSQANSAINSVKSAPVELTQIVRQAMYEWPRLLARVMAATNDRIKSNYVGLPVLSGMTLMNTLYNICRVVHVDPILKKLGRNLDAPVTTVLSKINKICIESGPSAADYKVNTLMLLYYLLDAYPIIGELEGPDSTPFFSYLDEKVGSAAAIRQESLQQPEPGQQPEPESEPEQTDPEQTEPEQTDPEQTDPEQTEPEQTEPEQTDPEQTDPEQTDPEQTDPEQTDPEQTDPEQTDPEQTDPEQTDPEQTDPEQTDP
ncbi:MAG: hypothetical protein LBJ89_02575, partial [Holosporales bacterium]|nr:hypothetical protein [Holosporales bacterium]